MEVRAELREENSMEENREVLRRAVKEVEAAGGGTVHLPSGTFKDSRMLHGLMAPGTTIRGVDAQSTFLAHPPQWDETKNLEFTAPTESRR